MDLISEPSILPHPKDGWLLHPHDDEIIADDEQQLISSIPPSERQLQDRKKLKVTRYLQEWRLLRSRTVYAKMTMEFSILSGSYDRGFKSIVDDSHVKRVQIVNVWDGEGGESLKYSTYANDSNFLFVEWTYPKALIAGDVSTVIVEYRIYNGIQACGGGGTQKDYYEPFVNVVATPACAESFHAKWANYWRAPVSGISYSFTMPAERDEEFDYYFRYGGELIPYLVSPRVCTDKNNCGDTIRNANGDGITSGPSLSYNFTPASLRMGIFPNDVAFGWRTKGYCPLDLSNTCPGVSYEFRPFHIVLLLPLVALISFIFNGVVWRQHRLLYGGYTSIPFSLMDRHG